MLLLIIPIQISNSNGIDEISNWHPVNRMSSLSAALVDKGHCRLLPARPIPREPVIISLCEIIVLWDKVK